MTSSLAIVHSLVKKTSDKTNVHGVHDGQPLGPRASRGLRVARNVRTVKKLSGSARWGEVTGKWLAMGNG